MTNQVDEFKLDKNESILSQTNFINLLNRLNICERSIKELAIRVEYKNSNINPPKVNKVLSQIPNYLPLIQKLLEDGKMWSTHQMEEEIKALFPELPAPKFASLSHACNTAAKRGLITKIANNVYRQK